MSRYIGIALQVGEIVASKNAAYGDSVRFAEEALQLLYPNGIAREQMGDVLLITRILDKLSRVANDRDAMGESPFLDIAGYGILGAARQGQNEGAEVATVTLSRRIVSAAVPEARVCKAGRPPKRQILQPGVPNEGLQVSKRTQAGDVSALPQKAARPRKAVRKVTRKHK